MIDFYTEKLNNLDKAIHQAELDQRKLNNQVEKNNQEIQQIGYQGKKARNQVATVVEMKEKGTLQLKLSYIV